MKWFKGFPVKSGIYLRNNPPLQLLVLETLYESDEELWVVCQDTPDRTVKELPHFGNHFWWFGPIPDFPGKQKIH